MAKIVIVGDAMVVTSAKTLEAIKTLEKYKPKALCLFDKDEESGKMVEVFRVASAKGEGSINQYGASFGSVTHDEAKNATITMQIPANTENVEAYAYEKLGAAIAMLNRVEAQIDGAVQAVAQEKEAFKQNITVA